MLMTGGGEQGLLRTRSQVDMRINTVYHGALYVTFHIRLQL
jgi:hypothetical protein